VSIFSLIGFVFGIALLSCSLISVIGIYNTFVKKCYSLGILFNSLKLFSMVYIYMSDNQNDTEDDVGLTKPKKIRSEAQKAATERMRNANEAKQIASGKMTMSEKKLRLQALKEQLNGPSLKQKKEAEKAIVKPDETDTEILSESEDEDVPVPVPKKKESKIVSQSKSKPKKEPTVVYESASESEEEVIIVKKKKKKPKKTIIYESSSEEEAPAPAHKSRDTKTQQNSSSKFKVTLPDTKPKGPVYYFAD
jgi:hypothetical protein